MHFFSRKTKLDSSPDTGKSSFPSQKSSLGIRGLHRFFFVHFYSDSLKDMQSIEEAVQEYLKEGLDPQGALLLKETNELLAKNLSNNELSVLIEGEWNAEVESDDVGSWNAVLQKVHNILTGDQHHETFNASATKLIESLRPLFVAHPDVDEKRLNVILELFHDGEPDIALDSLIENLQDMNWDKVDAPISEEQSKQLKYLLHGVYGYEPEREQKYLAIVNHVTEAEVSNK